jgi:N-acetylglucosaminyldiphosphoundecaprenol N-acetyl-beta-D-mannosaminyltransferase
MNMLCDIQPDLMEMFHDDVFSVLGVQILNTTRQHAVEILESIFGNSADAARSVFIVNAHTLNLTSADPQYREVLNSGDYVFGDGTGVRWAAKLQGIKVLDNFVGTDFIPYLFQSTAGSGYSYFMLGGDQRTIDVAANYAKNEFPGWTLCGYHHGYLPNSPDAMWEIIEQINQAAPNVLLVGMGNPIQEQWIHQYQSSLRVPICMGIGGLFDYWAGNVSRAPAWLRRWGHEWLWRLYQQPRDKMYRYVAGNPLFLARILRERFIGHKNIP